MTAIEYRVREVLKTLDRELRPPVIHAFESSDGTLMSFIMELESQASDFPDLPVEDIIDTVARDVV